MPHKRVVRVISIEGNADWVDYVLERSKLNGELRTIFRKEGTVREIYRVEAAETEALDMETVACIMRCMNTSH